jgi:nucleoside-diphosphate-sugar epimerase
MNILITGAGGFVGKRLTRYLAEQGHDIFALVRSMPQAEDQHYFSSERVDVLQADLFSLECSQLPEKIDALYTLAQSAHFREFPEQAEDIFAVNIVANFKLWQWAVKTGVRKCIHISSGGIYGGKPGKIFHEDDLLAVDSPLGFYLGSKLCSEIIFQNYHEFFETALILRPFFIYGSGQRQDMLIPRLIHSVKTGKPILLQGEQGLRMNPVFVNDAVIAFANALHLEGCHIINVAGPDVLSLRQIGEIIGNVVDKEPIFEKKSGDSLDYVANTAQTVRKLYQPMTSFKKGIVLTVQ